MNITILNLSRETTAEELRELFAPYGTVKSCDIVMDKLTNLSKGFGFVKMLNDKEGNAAITNLHGKNVGGNKIRVKASSKEK